MSKFVYAMTGIARMYIYIYVHTYSLQTYNYACADTPLMLGAGMGLTKTAKAIPNRHCISSPHHHKSPSMIHLSPKTSASTRIPRPMPLVRGRRPSCQRNRGDFACWAWDPGCCNASLHNYNRVPLKGCLRGSIRDLY